MSDEIKKVSILKDVVTGGSNSVTESPSDTSSEREWWVSVHKRNPTFPIAITERPQLRLDPEHDEYVLVREVLDHDRNPFDSKTKVFQLTTESVSPEPSHLLSMFKRDYYLAKQRIAELEAELEEAKSNYWYRKAMGAEIVTAENKRIFVTLEKLEKANADLKEQLEYITERWGDARKERDELKVMFNKRQEAVLEMGISNDKLRAVLEKITRVNGMMGLGTAIEIAEEALAGEGDET